MFILGDALAHVTSFAIELALILLEQVATVLGHVFLFAVLQALFATSKARGLSTLQLAVLHAVTNSFLLVGFALIHLIDVGMAGIFLACASAGTVAALGLSSGRSSSQQTSHCEDYEDCVILLIIRE